MDSASQAAFALAKKNPKKGEAYSLKNIAKQTKIKDTLNWEGTTPKRKVEEKKKKKTTDDIKIDKNKKKKKTKGGSGSSNTSGPGDANL